MLTVVAHDSTEFPVSRDLWRDLAAAFEIPHVYLIGEEHRKGFIPYNSGVNLPMHRVTVVTPAESAEHGLQAQRLTDFVHPEGDAAYLFGPDDNSKGWWEPVETPFTRYVTIHTPGSTELYAVFAAAMVFGHRIWGS